MEFDDIKQWDEQNRTVINLQTRNSAVADKPRDTFLQMQWRCSPLKTRPSSYVLPCRIWSFCLKGCTVRINTGNPKNRAALELRSLGTGGVADPKIHAPHMCYHVTFGSYATKGYA